MRLTPSTRCHSSRLVSSTAPAWPMPALLCSTSTPLSAANTASAKASTAAGSLTSTAWAVARPPPASMCETASETLSWSRSAAWTVAPSRPRRSAVERPIPEPAPVTTATCPAKFLSADGTRTRYLLRVDGGAGAVLAGALGAVESGVRASEERLPGRSVGGVAGDADADPQCQREVRLGHGQPQPLGDGHRILLVEPRHQHAELLAPDAEDAILVAHALAQRLGDVAERVVADLVAVGVVDGLEVVDVGDGDAEATLATVLGRQLERLVEGAVAEQPGEAVVAGLPRHAVDQPPVGEGRGGVGDYAGEPVEQVRGGVQPLRGLGDGDGEDSEEAPAGRDRDDDDGAGAEVVQQPVDEGIVRVVVEEQRPRLVCGEHLAQVERVRGGDPELAQALVAVTGVAEGGLADEDALGLVPDEHPGAVAVHDGRHGRGDSPGDLLAGAGGGHRP